MKKLKVLLASLFLAMTVTAFSSCSLLFSKVYETGFWLTSPGTWVSADPITDEPLTSGNHTFVLRLDCTGSLDGKEISEISMNKFKKKDNRYECSFYLDGTNYEFWYIPENDSGIDYIKFTKGLIDFMVRP